MVHMLSKSSLYTRYTSHSRGLWFPQLESNPQLDYRVVLYNVASTNITQSSNISCANLSVGHRLRILNPSTISLHVIYYVVGLQLWSEFSKYSEPFSQFTPYQAWARASMVPRLPTPLPLYQARVRGSVCSNDSLLSSPVPG